MNELEAEQYLLNRAYAQFQQDFGITTPTIEELLERIDSWPWTFRPMVGQSAEEIRDHRGTVMQNASYTATAGRQVLGHGQAHAQEKGSTPWAAVAKLYLALMPD
jgi:hypothetical protein